MVICKSYRGNFYVSVIGDFYCDLNQKMRAYVLCAEMNGHVISIVGLDVKVGGVVGWCALLCSKCKQQGKITIEDRPTFLVLKCGEQKNMPI